MKNYIKPEIAVTEIALESILAGSMGASTSLDNSERNTITNSNLFESKKHNGMTSLWDFDTDDDDEE